jgi:hypothetical protein
MAKRTKGQRQAQAQAQAQKSVQKPGKRQWLSDNKKLGPEHKVFLTGVPSAWDADSLNAFMDSILPKAVKELIELKRPVSGDHCFCMVFWHQRDAAAALNNKLYPQPMTTRRCAFALLASQYFHHEERHM